MRTIIPGEIPTRDLHQFIVGSIAPRPIAFVSTVDEEGNTNLAPYSFFNAFSSNPPIVVFSSNRRVSNNTTKDTLHNVQATGEAVINVVNHAIVHQMAVASIEFPTSISEFDKTGLTPLASDVVKPFRVAESPVQLECKVNDIITLGEHGGAGHLVICDIVRMHINEDVIDEHNRIDPQKLDLMGRLGRAYYVRVQGDAIKTIVQPVTQLSIGYDQLPVAVQQSTVLSGNDIGKLAGLHVMPSEEEVDAWATSDEKTQALLANDEPVTAFHEYAKSALDQMRIQEAMMVLLSADKKSR